MAKKKADKVLVRLGVSDIVLTDKELEKCTGYITVLDENGNTIAETSTYVIGYEDEDGNECHEDGEYFN